MAMVVMMAMALMTRKMKTVEKVVVKPRIT